MAEHVYNAFIEWLVGSEYGIYLSEHGIIKLWYMHSMICRFLTWHNLRGHIKTIHKGNKEYKCESYGQIIHKIFVSNCVDQNYLLWLVDWWRTAVVVFEGWLVIKKEYKIFKNLIHIKNVEFYT